MYEGTKTQVRSSVGLTARIPLRVVLHQGSALSPYLFDLITDVLSQGIRVQSPWCMLFADDIVMQHQQRGSGVKTRALEEVADDGNLDVEITYRVQTGWKNRRKMSGVLCDRRINVKVKGRVCKTGVRPALMHGEETWPVERVQEKKLDVIEMKMLREESGADGGAWGRARGRLKKLRRWMDVVKEDLRDKQLSEDDGFDRARWRKAVRNIDPHIEVGKDAEKKEDVFIKMLEMKDQVSRAQYFDDHH
ncbi:uncharacterized protein [Macrobrachium rosenbergii]|uniref:uncharacterized protein n=1 Tax=Macrobrachium rosenbergii TaxID=79674 RepID=UPI0034D6B2EB